VQQRCRNIDYNTTLEWGADSTRQVMAQTAGTLMFHLDQPPKNNPRSEQMIRVCSAATAGADWVVSPRGVQSAGEGEWAKSRLEGERHGPAAAWQTTGRPRGCRGRTRETRGPGELRLEGRYLSQRDGDGATWQGTAGG
jgi:hypothetical protein